MVSRSAQSIDVKAPAAQPRTPPERARQADRAAIEQVSPLARSALAFAAQCHARQQGESDDAASIEHPLEVAGLLHDAGCSDVVVAAGLLHDVVEETHVSVAELTARFGADLANLVHVVSDASVGSYRQRKQVQREQVRSAGGDAALLFAADKIAKVRELPGQVRRDRARLDATMCENRTRDHLERYHQMRLEHYHESLQMLRDVAPGHPLVEQLANELHDCPIVLRSGGA